MRNLILLIVLPLVAGCGAARSVARHEARAAVLLVTDAVKEADSACAKLAEQQRDHDMAANCARQYDAARSHLVNVAKAVDAFNTGKARDVLCGTIAAADEMRAIAEIVSKGGGRMPPLVDDALEYASKLGGCK